MTLHEMFQRELANEKGIIVGRVPEERRADAEDIKRMRNEITGKVQANEAMLQRGVELASSMFLK